MLIPRLYLILGAVAVTLAAVGTIAYQHRVIANLKLDNAALTERVADKDSVIDDQAKGIKSMIAASLAAEAALKAAGDTLETAETQLAAERAKRRQRTETDYAIPACRTLLETDLAGACPANARSVRDAAAHR